MKLITLGFDLKYTNNQDLWFEFDNQEDVKLLKNLQKKMFYNFFIKYYS